MNSLLARLVSIGLVVALTAPALPAFAVEVVGPVPNDCTVGGHPLLGLDSAEARALIASATPLPGFAPLTVTAAGKIFVFSTRTALALDIEAMLAQAYEPTTTVGFEIAPKYSIKGAVISSWVAGRVSSVARAPVDAKYVARDAKMIVKPHVAGRGLDRAASVAIVRAAVASALTSGETTTATVPLKVNSIAPRVTKAKLGKVVHADLSERRIRLYDKGKLLKKYRCAVGARGYATPTGTFTITAKRKNPTWGNPGSAWARRMPRFIGPSPYNPLGTRALNLDAPGIRIHGTSKRYSIGTAASKGCLRMLREDVEDLFDRVPVGTKVHIVK